MIRLAVIEPTAPTVGRVSPRFAKEKPLATVQSLRGANPGEGLLVDFGRSFG